MARPDKREQIFEFIDEEYRKNGFSPSINDIATHLGLSAKSNIHRQLQQLVAEGRLVNLGGRYVPALLRQNGSSDVVFVPLVGTVAAGSPIFAVENLDGYVAYIPRFGDSRNLFALRVKGDSMIEAGIFSGDIVIVEKTPMIEPPTIATTE